jgi:hypothetical protein
MVKRIIRKRPLTDEEVERYSRIRAQIAAELPDIQRRAKAAKSRILLKRAAARLSERETPKFSDPP